MSTTLYTTYCFCECVGGGVRHTHMKTLVWVHRGQDVSSMWQKGIINEDVKHV